MFAMVAKHCNRTVDVLHDVSIDIHTYIYIHMYAYIYVCMYIFIALRKLLVK